MTMKCTKIQIEVRRLGIIQTMMTTILIITLISQKPSKFGQR